MSQNIKEIINKEKNHGFFICNFFICEIWRHENLHLNGYIYIPKGHPWYNKHYDDLDARVHGGLTYSGMDNTGLWRLGFDTAHAGDFIPGFADIDIHFNDEDVYRDWDYVTNELENLARQAFDVMEYVLEEEEIEKILAKKILML